MGGTTFRADLAAAVMAGEKTVTRRLCSDNPRSPWWRQECALKLGKDYAVQPGRGKPAIGRAVVRSVRREPLGHLDVAEARREGFASVAEFEATFAGINGAYDPTVEVWRVELQARGVCPVCVSEEDVDAVGRIAGHKQMLGYVRTDVDCGGGGQLPDGES